MTKQSSLYIVFLCLMIFLAVASKFVKAEGSTQWDILYDLHGSGRCVIQTRDGGYAIAGNSDDQFLFLKVNSSGGVQWEKTYGEGAAYSIIETDDGGYALAGWGENFNFVKADSSGELQWSKNFTNQGVRFYVQSLIQTADGGYAMAGWTSTYDVSSPNWDWTIKTDSYGNLQWNKTYGLRSGISHAQEILHEVDGGYILAANRNVSKLDSKGDMQWTSNCVVANALIKTSDGGYLVAAGNGATLVKMDQEGNTEWSQSYQYHEARWSFFNSVKQTSDGGYVVAGVTYPVYDGLAWILKLDEDGLVEGEITFPPDTGINNRAHSIVEASDGGYVFVGSKNADNGEGNIWLKKMAPSVIPEFPSWAILPVILIASFLVVIIRKKMESWSVE